MNKTVEEMARQKCECSSRCKCTLTHEGGGCDGKGCPCWCHKVIPFWESPEGEAIKKAFKVKKGDKEEKEE
jgi:hypothetical protein